MQQAINFDALWAQVKPVVTSILCQEKNNIDSQRWMQTYNLVYTFVSKDQQKCAELYNAVVDIYRTRARALVGLARTLSDEEILRFFSESWTSWCRSAKIISHVFAYMERMWVGMRPGAKGKSSALHLDAKANEVWRETLFVVGLKEKLCPALVHLIQEERAGGVIQQHLIRSCLDCLKKMDSSDMQPLTTYRDHFEKYFLARTQEYYINESANVLKSGNPMEYMHFVDARIKDEQKRVQDYLDPSTKKPLMKLLDTVLLSGHADSLQSLFDSSLSKYSVDEVTCIYRLLSRINAVDPLFKVFENHVANYGRMQLESIKGEMKANPRIFVDTLLAVYQRFARLVTDAFRNNKNFRLSIDTAFNQLINHNSVTTGTGTANSTAAMLLAKYCDTMLRRGSPLLEGDVDQLQSDVVALFRYLPDKDVFMQFYCKLMAKRFISGASVGEELELAMINKLKAIQGSEFTTKATRMIAEVNVNETLNSELQEYMKSKRENAPFSISIMVLSSGSWPINSQQTLITLPRQVEQVMKTINVFYSQKHKGRKINHAVSLSHAEIAFSPMKNRYQLSVTAFQMAILLYAADRTAVSLRELSNETQIPNKVLCQQLSPVVRSHVFTCSDGLDSASWSDETLFTVNPKFAYKKLKLSLMSLNAGNSGRGAKKSEESGGAADMEHAEAEDIMRDRAFKLEAAVVRIMKSRRVLDYNTLVKEVVDQVSHWFTPQIPMIKRAVESLLDQEFIRRKGDSMTLLEYIA